MTSKTATIALAGIAMLAASCFQMPRYVVWNVSESIPRGFYWIDRLPARRGDIVSVRLPDATADFAGNRAYLPKTAVLIKQVAASGGDQVCRFGTNVYINVRQRGSAQIRDRAGRPMPVWSGCRILRANEAFLLGQGPASFDSRYFGHIDALNIIGRATLIW